MKKLRVLSKGVDGTTLTIYKGYSDEFLKFLYFRVYNTVTQYVLQNLGTFEEDKDNKVVFESFDDTVRIEVELLKFSDLEVLDNQQVHKYVESTDLEVLENQ